MLKFAYFGLVAAFAVTLITVSLDRGILSAGNKENLTAGFKLVAEIPIGDKQLTTGDSRPTIAQKPIEKLPASSAWAVAKPKPVPIPIPGPTPVLKPAIPNPVVIAVSVPIVESRPVVASEPTPALVPIFEPEPRAEPTPEPEPLPSPTSLPGPTPTPEPTPAPEPEPTPPPAAPEPTPIPEPEPIQVLIVEIQTGTTAGGAEDEFVKLYNPTNSEIDLTGWALKKKSSTGTFSNLVSAGAFTGKIAAKGYFVVAHENYAGALSVNLRYSANSNNLAYTNNSAVLYYSDGSVMDEIFWGDPGIPKDTIWTRP